MDRGTGGLRHEQHRQAGLLGHVGEVVELGELEDLLARLAPLVPGQQIAHVTCQLRGLADVAPQVVVVLVELHLARPRLVGGVADGIDAAAASRDVAAIVVRGEGGTLTAGYDLTRMFVGSEGTLGVITDITLRLYGIPETISSAVCTYPTVDDAVNTVILTIQSGVPIARIELIDEVQMQALNKFAGLGYAERPTLFFEFHGNDERGVTAAARAVEALARELGCDEPRWAVAAEERRQLWQARKQA